MHLVHSKTRKQIADEYGIDYKTLMRWLKNQQVQIPSGLVHPKLQKSIYNSLGYPNPELKLLLEKI